MERSSCHKVRSPKHATYLHMVAVKVFTNMFKTSLHKSVSTLGRYSDRMLNRNEHSKLANTTISSFHFSTRVKLTS